VAYIAYDYGRELVEMFGLLHAALVIGGLVVVCRVADLVAPQRDGSAADSAQVES